jgi:Fe2+ transport system protein FeoA
MRALSQLTAGDKALVHSIEGGAAGLRQKFMAFGLLPGALLEIVRFAPMGDPMHIKLASNLSFSISKSEAAVVMVEKV